MLTLHQSLSPGKSKIAIPAQQQVAPEPPMLVHPSPLKQIEQYSLYIIVPLLGILLPVLGGLNVLGKEPWLPALANNVYYVGLAILIFKGNLYFLKHYRLRKHNGLLSHFQLLARFYVLNLSYTALIALAGLSAWNTIMMHRPPFEKEVVVTTLLILVSTLLINNLFEMVLVNAEKKYAAERLRLSEEQRTVAELKMLNSQMDPHFIFNALSGLCCYIKQDPILAGMYTTKLADMYAYVLEQRNNMLTPLQDELRFCENYFFLQQLRFGQAIQIRMTGMPDQQQDLRLPPLTLQTLVENAIKHNCFSTDNPLVISIRETDGYIVIQNNIQPGKTGIDSGGLGLYNLNERVQMITRKPIKVSQNKGVFVVSVPLA